MSETTSTEISGVLNRVVRKGDWRELAVSTYQKIEQALERHDAPDAVALTRYSVDEARIIYDVMRQWQSDLRDLMADKGFAAQEISAIQAGIVALLKLPEGAPYEHAAEWLRHTDLAESVISAAERGAWDEARSLVPKLCEQWRRVHDRDADWTYGLMSALVERHGELVVPEIYDKIIWPLFNWRYAKFDISHHDWDQESLPVLMYVSLESMRAHLCTSQRDGKVPLDLIEEEDRWIIQFDPCGSGGRIVRGDWVENTPSRLEAPYNFKRIEGAYDWTDNKKGVCIYCNHCQVMMEHMAIDRFGYPVRVVEPPIYPDKDRGEGRQRCQWIMYKDPKAVPESYYTRAGRTKPTEFGSDAHGGPLNAAEEKQGFIGRG